ncbi:MAG: ABC transporter permease [Clostridiales Family XIII bacterium]|jgi:simple sugar transport system permease protein|nr:ABC transporter permease [Clostridiales Family XIII bacterium]
MKFTPAITQRTGLSTRQSVTYRAIAILLSVVGTGLVLMLFGLNPVRVFGAIIEGSMGTPIRIHQMINSAIPLVISTLGIIVAFKMKFWNIGGEGQIVMGAFGAAFVAYRLPDLPQPLLLLLMAVAAAAAGALWALIPAAFKAKMGTNETIFTLMMNYIAILFVTFLQYGPWKDPARAGFPRMPDFSPNAVLPNLFGNNIGWVIAMILTAFVYVFLSRTKKGYEITVVGESPETARYAGMNIPAIIIVAMAVSGGLCGLVGMIQASAIEKTLTATISAGYGFTAIITAWLARLNAIVALFVCVVFAMLVQGAAFIQLSLGVPAAVAGVVQGTILLFILGSEFFIQFKVRLPERRRRTV